MKQTARERLLALVKEKGWQPDPGRTRPKSYRRYDGENERIQDPHAFVKDAAHGGQWTLYLDYTIRSSFYGSTGDRLQSVSVGYIAPGEEPTPDSYAPRSNIGVLQNPGKYTGGYGRDLWEALAIDGKVNGGTITERAALLVSNPDVAVWLSFQRKHDRKVESERRAAEWKRDRDERNRPLPITVEHNPATANWITTPWRELTKRAERAAAAVKSADGKSDLYALVDELEAATAAIRAVMKERVSA